MTNHLHALMQIADRPLGILIQRIAMRYSRYRHKALNTTGHLFERRHKAKLVDVDGYFLTLLRYIHLNPVSAGIVASPSRYRWSSHRAYLGVESIPWLTTDFGLAMFSDNIVQARAAYERFVLAPANGDEDLDQQCHPDDSRVLGTDEFISTIPAARCKQQGLLTLEQLATLVSADYGISASALRSPSRARHLAKLRVVFAQQAIERGIATVSAIATFLNRDPSSLTKLLARHDAKI
jgi:hypothetical protein